MAIYQSKFTGEQLEALLTLVEEGGNGSGESNKSNDMIYFDYSKINQNNPNIGTYHDVVLFELTRNVHYKNVPLGYLIDYSYGNETGVKFVEAYDPNFAYSVTPYYTYVAFTNKITVPQMAIIGSGGLPTGSIAGQSMSLYEYLAEINNIVREESIGIEGDFIPINEIKNAEVTEDEIIEWLNAQS